MEAFVNSINSVREDTLSEMKRGYNKFNIEKIYINKIYIIYYKEKVYIYMYAYTCTCACACICV